MLKKRVASLFLAGAMLFLTIPLQAMAAENSAHEVIECENVAEAFSETTPETTVTIYYDNPVIYNYPWSSEGRIVEIILVGTDA